MAGSSEMKGEESQLSCEEQASLDEIIMNAKKSFCGEDMVNHSLVAENNAEVATGHLIVLGGNLSNLTKGPLTVGDSKLWAGYIIKDYPKPLVVGTSLLQMVQVGVSNDGLKAAVLYTGKNIACVDCGWLLAWADSQGKGKRVYAECGPISKFNCLDWARIEKKLDDPCCPAINPYKASDEQTGTSVIVGLSGVEWPLTYETRDLLAGIISC